MAARKPFTYASAKWHVDTHELNVLADRLLELSDGQLQEGAQVGNQAAVDFVMKQARGKAAFRRQAEKVADDAEAFYGRTTKTSGTITLRGGKRFASGDPHDPLLFAFGAEFGANRDRKRVVPVRSKTDRGQGKVKGRRDREHSTFGTYVVRGWNQFLPWRGSGNVDLGAGIQPGYWLWPAVRDSRDEVTDVYGQASMAAFREILSRPPEV